MLYKRAVQSKNKKEKMKSFALAAIAALSVATELDGYTIELCPEPYGTTDVGGSIYLPGNEEALALKSAWARVGVPNIYQFDRLAAHQKL